MAVQQAMLLMRALSHKWTCTVHLLSHADGMCMSAEGELMS